MLVARILQAVTCLLSTHRPCQPVVQEHLVLSTWSLGLEPSRVQSPLLQQVGFPTLPFQAPAEGLNAADAELTSWLDQSTDGVVYVAYG